VEILPPAFLYLYESVLRMINILRYSIFQDFPEITCFSVWNTGQSEVNSNLSPSNFEKFYIDESISAFAEQVHGTNIKIVQSNGIRDNCDGLISDKSKLNLIIRTADCASVMIYDSQKKIIANVHAGWRGIKKKVVKKAIQELQRNYNSNTNYTVIAISPHIKSCCYQVGIEFKKYFKEKYLHKRGGDLFFDLTKILLDQLLETGVPLNQIQISPHCTFCSDKNLFSYRRNKTNKRIINVIKKIIEGELS
jgi:YfiH family protein